MTDERIAINDRRSKWVGAVNSKDIDTYLDIVSEEVSWFPPGTCAIIGRSDFREWVLPFFATYDYQFEIIGPKVAMAGDWATEHGVFKSTILHEGKSSTHEGQYLIIWHKCEDNVWRIDRYVDMTVLLKESA